MGRSTFHSPSLTVKITDEAYKKAVESSQRGSSGGCLISDAIKAQYPQYTHPSSDVVACRISDPKRGVRFTYFMPDSGKQLLLGFDQGWDKMASEITLRRAVKIDPIQAKSTTWLIKRAARFAELEAKEASGETMAPHERASLTRMRNNPDVANRPLSRGPGVIKTGRTVAGSGGVVQTGGQRVPRQPRGATNPNLLAGRDRHFGAKMAKPGIVWEEALEKAVDKAVEERLAQMGISPK